MKRSQMLKILRESFIFHTNNPFGAESDDEMYSNILFDLEKAGMKPPKSVLDPVLLTNKFVWEPEEIAWESKE